MSQKNKRRLAADARRAAENDPDNRSTSELRDLLRRNYERGLEDGREQERVENAYMSPRLMMLDTASSMLEQAADQTKKIPNSDRTISAYLEAVAILRDAATLGEPPADEQVVEQED